MDLNLIAVKDCDFITKKLKMVVVVVAAVVVMAIDNPHLRLVDGWVFMFLNFIRMYLFIDALPECCFSVNRGGRPERVTAYTILFNY